MPPTGLESSRMNRKKGDKGFESPRPYKLTHQVVCINNINFQRKSVVVRSFPVIINSLSHSFTVLGDSVVFYIIYGASE